MVAQSPAEKAPENDKFGKAKSVKSAVMASRWRMAGAVFAALAFLAIGGGIAATYLLWQYGQDLPDYRALANYAPPLMTRVYASDGKLLQEYAIEGRVF